MRKIKAQERNIQSMKNEGNEIIENLNQHEKKISQIKNIQ